jgi:hypothetical protein
MTDDIAMLIAAANGELTAALVDAHGDFAPWR